MNPGSSTPGAAVRAGRSPGASFNRSRPEGRGRARLLSAGRLWSVLLATAIRLAFTLNRALGQGRENESPTTLYGCG